jgi:hypothetical protein
MHVLYHFLKIVMHYDQLIAVSFLNRRRGREKRSKEGMTITAGEGLA